MIRIVMDQTKGRKLVMIDCSHGNSGKKSTQQKVVIRELIDRSDIRQILGLMMESFILEGRVDLSKVTTADYGRSVTDECMSWEDTESLMLDLHHRLDKVDKYDGWFGEPIIK